MQINEHSIPLKIISNQKYKLSGINVSGHDACCLVSSEVAYEQVIHNAAEILFSAQRLFIKSRERESVEGKRRRSSSPDN